jgi:hypothetical protein
MMFASAAFASWSTAKLPSTSLRASSTSCFIPSESCGGSHLDHFRYAALRLVFSFFLVGKHKADIMLGNRTQTRCHRLRIPAIRIFQLRKEPSPSYRACCLSAPFSALGFRSLDFVSSSSYSNTKRHVSPSPQRPHSKSRRTSEPRYPSIVSSSLWSSLDTPVSPGATFCSAGSPPFSG